MSATPLAEQERHRHGFGSWLDNSDLCGYLASVFIICEVVSIWRDTVVTLHGACPRNFHSTVGVLFETHYLIMVGIDCQYLTNQAQLVIAVKSHCGEEA